jgi:6-phosphogluconolactonase (cycloisomerase 2 family)
MKRNLFKIFLAPMGLVVLSAALRAGDTAISDGQNAEYVLGQTDGGGALIYTEGDALNSQTLDGFKLSYDVALDTASHRLFVTDLGTNRVLVYNLDSNNVLVDRSADNVIGQTNYLKFFGSTAQNRLNDPGGLIYDSAAQYLYVADSSNDRVMIFDVASVTDGENAINVLGQSNFTSGSNATDQNRLSYPTGVVLDKATNRLFVSDTSSNRVMVFDVGSITDGENAINVLGQTDFTTATSGRAQNKLYGQYNIDFDPTTNRLFVADYGNDRIMVFDVAAVTDGENAINVLGQINFTASGAAVSQSRMNEPRDAAINPLTQQLFVSLLDQNRILVFDVTAITDGENAVNVLGQSDFTTSVAATTQAGLWSPRGIGIDPPTDRLFVADGTNNRVLFFNASTTTITNGQNASDVLGQTDGAGGGVYTTGGGYDNRADDGMLVPYGVVVDTTSHRLFVSEYEAHRVAVYDLDASNTLVDQSMDYVLGQPDFSRIGADNTQWNLNFPYGLALDGDSDRLFVSDNSNDRVLVFDVAQITNGENAVNVLGQSNFTGNTGATTQSRLMLPGEIAYEAETSRLFVTDRSNHRVMVFDVASITDGENAVSVLGQSDFTSNSAGTTQAKMSTPNGIALDLNNRLFVAETGNHRVLVFDVTSITDGENAINVLGQTDFTSSSSSTSQSKFNYPAGLAYNNALSRLFVSESTNDRVTVFDTLVITDGENAVNVLGQTSFTGSSNATAQNRMYYARGLSIDEGLNRLFVADAYNHRIIVHSVGPVAPSTSTLSATGGGDQIALSWNSTGDDGAFNNLTGNYRIQYATYTASWSTSTTPTNATTVTISTTNAVPGSAQSRIISGLTIGTTYYFVLWTADEVPNWSGVSNTTSAVPTAWFDPNQIEVDGANGGIKSGGQGWGDFDNDGDLDIVAAGYTGTTRELRIYSNNGNGTIDVTQIEVDGAGNGLDDGDVIWGDYDNDGDLDIAVMGNTGSNRQLRIYKNNGNATMNATQIEVDGANNGLSQGRLGWGDYDNDGDLDLLVNGRLDANATPYLRIYKNNGNGTINPTEIEVDPADGGLLGECAWGDFDNDGDLDILIGGGGTESRVYGNNGNGTFNPTQISVGNTGIGYPAVSWGDFDADGDLDVLSNGYHVSEGRNTFINKNNGNGTFNGTPLYVDGFNGGLASGRSAWGDFDNDGDLDILTSGVSSDWTSRQLRVYKNNGNGTFNETQFEIEGVNNGLESTVATWGDFDNDGDLDILASGTDDGTNQQLRIYKNLATPSNTTPSAPTTLAGGFTFNASGVSVASMTWNTGVDGGASPTPENVLTYDIQISTVSNFGNVIFPGQMGASPRMGSYLKPPKIFNSNTYYGVTLKSTDPWNTQTTASYGLRTDTTYYYRVKTVDAGQAESGWSNGASINTAVSPSTSTLVAASTTNDYEITVTWNSAGDDGMSGNLTGNYRIQYATFTASWSTSTTPSDVTTVTISTTNAVPGTSQSRTFSSLTPGVTYYFVLWTADESSNWSTISNTPSALSTTWFDPNQIEVDGAAGGGLKEGDVAWGDFDADGDLDILLNGTVDWPTYQLRVYKNNGNGTIDPVQIEVDGLNNGLGNGEVQWGDYDVDGDLDILVAGRTGSTGELRIYKNNGNGTISPTQIEVDGAGNGGYAGGTEWGDFDNDGDLDILISGFDTSNNRLRIYKNNGNGTIDPTEIDVDGATVGGSSRVRWGDFDGDGDLDFMTLGMTIYKNNGNGTMNATEYLFGGYVDSALNTGGLQWGDFDNDGDLDVLASGTTNDQGRLRVYKNNGNGTLNSSEVVVDGAAGGLYLGDVAWGDYDNDGDIEIVASGYSSGAAGPELRVYKNNGNATIDAAQQEVDGAGGGLNSGAVAAGDYDGDGDLDILVVGEAAGSKELRIYKNLISTSNTTPTAPNTLAMGWTYNPSGVSVASFTWAAGTDSGTGSTSENGLTYDIQISTVSNFGNVIFPGQMGASPRMGSYLKPPKIFNSNTYYGVVMKSTDPWNAQSTASYGLRTDTTYYYRVKTVDAGLAESGWSSNGSAYTGVVPSTSTLTAASTVTDGQILLTWNSAGDDGMNGNLTGNYRIQYATYTPTWSTSSTPTNATTVTISTTNMVPGSAQSRLITGLASATRYYFAIWTQDDVNNWSTISNAASADSTLDVINPSTSTVTLSTVPGNPQLTVTWNSAGDDGSTGNLTGNYRIQYATYTASWSTSTTPTNATTVTISTTNVVPGSAQNYLISSLATVTTYYLALWTQDEANNWSNVSNTTSAVTSAVDTTAPEASSLFALSGTALGQIQLSWASAGDDGSTGNLTGYYRIQYATYTATWSTSTTPTNAYTSTITATNVTPGVVQSTSIVVSPTTYQPWYFVIWTMDDSNNWSTISSAATGYPAQTQSFGIGPNALATPGLAQGGSAWGDFDNDGDLDVLASGTDGTNNQIRVYRSNGMGTFDSTAVNVSAANSGLKDGDVAWGDFDSDGDLDVLASGSDGSNRQLRVYKNNGNGTFNTSAVEVPGSANVGLSTGAVTCGDFDNDGDLDVLAGGYDGTNNQLRVYKNNGNATFDGTAINVAGSNNGLRAGGVAWGDYDNDADLDVLISGTDGTNRQLRVYANNGNGTFNATATNVAGSNNGLSEGRVAWGDFDNDADLDVLVIGTDGTNFQLRTYSNNGNGTFNATATNVGGTNGGVNNSAVAVGDYNVDGNVDVLAAGRPNGLVGYWKFDENTGTATADATGNGYGGTLTSGPTWTSGKYSYGVNFDGSDDYVSVSGLTQPTSAMSFVAWVKANSTPAAYDSVAGNSDSSWSAGSWGLYYESALLKFWIEHYGNNVAYKTFNDLNWHFVVGTWDGTTVRLYIDAVEGTSDSYSGTMTQRSAFRIGDTVGSANRNFPGIIDEVRMYNRALSAAEITALYTAFIFHGQFSRGPRAVTAARGQRRKTG